MFTLVVYTVFMKRHSHGEEEVWCRCCQSQSGAVVLCADIFAATKMVHGTWNSESIFSQTQNNIWSCRRSCSVELRAASAFLGGGRKRGKSKQLLLVDYTRDIEEL